MRIKNTYIFGVGAVVKVLVPVNSDVVSSRDPIPVHLVFRCQIRLLFRLGNKKGVKSFGNQATDDGKHQTHH